jgi:ADP-ribose pyrophosphatase
MREKIIQTAHIYDGHLINLDLHKIEFPDGKRSKREIVTHPGAVAIVALDDKNNVLLVRQFRLAANDILLEIPAGTLDPGEPPEDCARRELQEEVGYQPKKLESLGGIFTAPGYTTEFIHLFLATELAESPLEGDADEFLEVVRMPLDDALKLIDDGKIIDSKTLSGLLRANRHLETRDQRRNREKKKSK